MTEKNIIEQIKEIRTERKISDYSLSKKGVISKSTLRRIDRGEVSPELRQIVALCNELNLTIEIKPNTNI